MVKWPVLLRKIAVWMLMEMMMEMTGFSQLANYGEFLDDQGHGILLVAMQMGDR